MDETHDGLILQAVAGDHAALERLLLMHYKKVELHIARQIPSWLQRFVSTEDILQEAFSQVFRDIRRFVPKSEQTFVAWLKTIAENRLQDVIKAFKRKKRGGDRHQVGMIANASNSSGIDLLNFLSDKGSTPSRVLRRAENMRAIQVAMASLPDDYRTVVRLRFLEGKTIAEIASHMQRSEKAVSGLLYRAKEVLRTSLGRASQFF